MQSASELVAAARRQIENLSAERVASQLGGEGAVVLVDVREMAEIVERGAIPGSVHVTRGMLEFLADPTYPAHRAELRPDRRVILYCASGSRSALAATALQDMGYTDVAHLDGGLNAWCDAGYATTLDTLLEDGDTDRARGGRSRRGSAGNVASVVVALVASVAALAVVGGASGASHPEAAVVRASPDATTEDPLIARFGASSRPSGSAEAQDPLVIRFGRRQGASVAPICGA